MIFPEVNLQTQNPLDLISWDVLLQGFHLDLYQNQWKTSSPAIQRLLVDIPTRFCDQIRIGWTATVVLMPGEQGSGLAPGFFHPVLDPYIPARGYS